MEAVTSSFMMSQPWNAALDRSMLMCKLQECVYAWKARVRDHFSRQCYRNSQAAQGIKQWKALVCDIWRARERLWLALGNIWAHNALVASVCRWQCLFQARAQEFKQIRLALSMYTVRKQMPFWHKWQLYALEYRKQAWRRHRAYQRAVATIIRVWLLHWRIWAAVQNHERVWAQSTRMRRNPILFDQNWLQVPQESENQDSCRWSQLCRNKRSGSVLLQGAACTMVTVAGLEGGSFKGI